MRVAGTTSAGELSFRAGGRSLAARPHFGSLRKATCKKAWPGGPATRVLALNAKVVGFDPTTPVGHRWRRGLGIGASGPGKSPLSSQVT
jgi:hypothetical protein